VAYGEILIRADDQSDSGLLFDIIGDRGANGHCPFSFRVSYEI
jgi:hypothetical protein